MSAPRVKCSNCGEVFMSRLAISGVQIDPSIGVGSSCPKCGTFVDNNRDAY